MKIRTLLATFAFLTLAACGSEGVAGDDCTGPDDCGDDLECHMEDGEDVGHCEEHHDDEEAEM